MIEWFWYLADWLGIVIWGMMGVAILVGAAMRLPYYVDKALVMLCPEARTHEEIQESLNRDAKRIAKRLSQ
jgi:hypothetical protein